MTDVCDFPSFYRAVHRGREPLPWQQRLAIRVGQSGWPADIGVPTGLGKTSCIDIAVWALARQADRPPAERTAPTRIWYVVNRRLLVDAAHDHAVQLARMLAEPDAMPDGAQRTAEDATAIRGVADALVSIRGGAGAEPLHVTRLRGGADLGARPPDPSQPALILATVAMFASRWLFRGFGTSAYMRSVDAALAGIDGVVLLDEAHLARPLRNLAAPLMACDVGDPAAVVPTARAWPRFVSLTATGDAVEPFTLDATDLEHPVVHRRLHAGKPTHLVRTTEKALPAVMIGQLRQTLASRGPCAAVVFMNSPGRAREVFDQLNLHGLGVEADLELLTGLMRDREADRARARLLDPVRGVPAGHRTSAARSRHLVVVATQTLEVGADLDFDVLITETCGARALVQRMGRLNRLGEIDNAAAVVVTAEDAKTVHPYGDEPREVWRRLTEAATDSVLDLGPSRIADVVGPPHDGSPRVGELLPAHLWEWAKTTTAPDGEAPPELFFAGFDEDVARVSICWRVARPSKTGAELRPPAFADEAVEVPLARAREALRALVGPTVIRLGPDRVSVEADVPVEQLRPGDHIVLASADGGCDEYGWAPGSRSPVFDVSLLRPPGVPITAEALRMLAAPGDDLDEAVAMANVLRDAPEPDEDIDRAALADQLRTTLLRAGPSAAVFPEEWERLADTLTQEAAYPIDDVPRLTIRRSRRVLDVNLRSDAFDELSFTATSRKLVEHLGTVGEAAAQIGARLGLPNDLVSAVRTAGRWHDLGKIDRRFQRWLDPQAEAAEPVAKSTRPWFRWEADRRAAGWPSGGRHEELSRRLAAAYLDGRLPQIDVELVLHLIVTHHGYGRPLVPPVRDGEAVAVEAEIDGDPVIVPGDLSQADWEQPSRFRRCCERYGYWGLALLEAIVRQADHQASRLAAI